MINYIEKIIRYVVRKSVYGYTNSGDLIKLLRSKGAIIGEGTKFFNAFSIKVDMNDAYMIRIGKNCQITGGVHILTHDYGWSVLKGLYGDVLGSVRPVDIGDNCYIGMNAMILAGSKIGNNVVIGANSVVSGTIPDNCVAVGMPCRPIYSIDKYYEKRLAAQNKEAIDIVKYYYESFGKYPEKEILSEHFWLFTNDKSEDIPRVYERQNNLIPGSESVTEERFAKHSLTYKNYDEFIKRVVNKIGDKE